jgi:hypothetical protein
LSRTTPAGSTIAVVVELLARQVDAGEHLVRAAEPGELFV